MLDSLVDSTESVVETTVANDAGSIKQPGNATHGDRKKNKMNVNIRKFYMYLKYCTIIIFDKIHVVYVV